MASTNQNTKKFASQIPSIGSKQPRRSEFNLNKVQSEVVLSGESGELNSDGLVVQTNFAHLGENQNSAKLPRKDSFTENAMEETKEHEESVMSKIMRVSQIKNILGKADREKHAKKDRQELNFVEPVQNTSSSGKSIEILPKRSKSETPSNQALADVLYQLHKGLQPKKPQRLSPKRLLEKHHERQRRAEQLRANIELNRKKLIEKVRSRQQEARDRFLEKVQVKRAILNEKLLDAAERREEQLQKVVETAKAENIRVQETNFIKKLTKQNQQLDIENRMTENEERRQRVKEQQNQEVKQNELRHQAADKRRRELSDETKSRFLSNEQKRVQADQRRYEKLKAEKTKATEERRKRDLVKARKHYIGHKITDIMSFLNNSDMLWDFIGKESDWQTLSYWLNTTESGEHEFGTGRSTMMEDTDSFLDQQTEELLRLFKKDQFELEKMILKRDQEILNHCLYFDVDGKLFVRQSPTHFIQQSNRNRSSSDDSFSSQDLAEQNPLMRSGELIKQEDPFEKVQEPEDLEKERNDTTPPSLPRISSYVSEEPKIPNIMFTDEYFQFKLQQQRLQMSWRRNILRRTLSEDLVWAECLKNEVRPEQFANFASSARKKKNNHFMIKTMKTRSLHSTPERTVKKQLNDSFGDLEDYPVLAEQEYEATKLLPQTSTKKNQHSKKNKHKSHSKLSNQNSHKNRKPTNTQLTSSTNLIQPFQTLVSLPQIDAFGKTKAIFSNHGSCTSRDSSHHRRSVQFLADESVPTGKSSLNQQQLDQLGPIVKMSINGFPLSGRTSIVDTASQQHSFIGAGLQSSDKLSVGDADQMSMSAISFVSNVTSSHMSSLIMNQKPIPPKQLHLHHLSNTSVQLSKNAQQYLFPIIEQKLLLMCSEKEETFAQARVVLKLEDVSKVVSEVREQNLVDSIEGNAEQSPTQISRSPTKANPLPQSQIPNLKKSAYDKVDFAYEPKRDSASKQNSLIESEQKVMKASKSDKQAVEKVVDALVASLLGDNLQYIKNNDDQKSLLIESHEETDASRIVTLLEQSELTFRFCRLCVVLIHTSACCDTPEHAISEHFSSKQHVKYRDECGIKEIEDLTFSCLLFSSAPGNIEVELKREKEKALKRKVKRIKTHIQQIAVSHENASTYPGKELSSCHKKRLQIRCIELEKSIFPLIKNYDVVDAILADVYKVMEKRQMADLHLMRKLKFVPLLIEICKRTQTCPKNELKHLGKLLRLVIKILFLFCSHRENRNYMLQTNRLMPLLELFNWCLNRASQIFFGIDFLPQLFQIINCHLKHRVPFECSEMKDCIVDYIISSQITAKIKSKHAIVKQIPQQEFSESMSHVPFFLLQSMNFLESLTQNISADSRTRPAYERSYKIGEHVYFQLQNTELFGVITTIATLLLTFGEPFKVSAPSSSSETLLPQTVLSLAIMAIKVLNNLLRCDIKIVQPMMDDSDDELFHLLNFLLAYSETHLDTNDTSTDDVRELLHETLLFIGYFALFNEKNQQILQRGENSILQKLCNMPFIYFMDKRNREILFPTLISATYQNQRSVQIMHQEMDLNMIVKYIQTNISEELPRIMEEQQECSSHTQSTSFAGDPNKRGRSPSISSTGSSTQSMQMDFLNGNNPYIPLLMRFPKKAWKDAAQFYLSAAEE